MKQTLLLILTLLIFSCSGSRQIEKQLSYGNYDKAINDAIRKLSTNKTRKGKSEYISLLKSAYVKANSKDLNDIKFLTKNNNPALYEQIFNTYINLRDRQERIKPLLPLYINTKEVKFNFTNYNSQIVNYKDKTSDYLYSQANNTLLSNNKLDARIAYKDFIYIEKINPNYKDVRQKINEALYKGRYFILLQLKNETQQIIPVRLEDDLLNISTYGLNNQWTVYHNNKQANFNYDYELNLRFKNISISPEQISERQISKERQIKNGTKNLLDNNGNVVKDSLGNAIQIDKFITVTCDYFETKQLKQTEIIASAEVIDLTTKQLIDAFPVNSSFVFEHIYANFQGDRRALDDNLINYLTNRRVPFPSNEQMIFDTGEDLKRQLKSIITNQQF
jgi:hypothetical protein